MDLGALPAGMQPVAEDLLSSLLGSYQLRTHVFANPRLCGDWRIGDTEDSQGARFHLLAKGRCWLHLHHIPPMQLFQGDLVVLPRCGWHMFASGPELPDTHLRMQTADAEPYTWLICGHFEFLAGAANPLLDTLPQALVIPASAMGARGRRVAEMLSEELADPQPGQSAVLDKLGDALFVMSLRYHIRHAENPHGLMAALADGRLARALVAIHQSPGRTWTVGDLAHVAAMSRTTFAEHFRDTVGLAPIDYLTRWRMTCAELMLTNPRLLSMNLIAEKLGYESVESFRRAFKRVHGRNPGAYKRALRQTRAS